MSPAQTIDELIRNGEALRELMIDGAGKLEVWVAQLREMSKAITDEKGSADDD